jgi:Spy/CpxP family protein refolding chaperone
MKFTMVRWMAALTLSSVVAGNLLAQEDPKPAESKVPPGAKIAARGDQLANLTEVLKLTEEQRTKIKPILEEQTKQIAALKAEKGNSLQERAAKYQQIRLANHEKVRAVLNPEQAEKWDKMRSVGAKPPAAIKPPAPAPEKK